jgi:hypothetical protein
MKCNNSTRTLEHRNTTLVEVAKLPNGITPLELQWSRFRNQLEWGSSKKHLDFQVEKLDLCVVEYKVGVLSLLQNVGAIH